MYSIVRVVVATAAVLPFLPKEVHAQRLMELEGIQLLGSARVVAYGAATCEIREGFEGDDKAWDPANRGQPLDVWQLDFSIYNGSGKWLDHLIARYNIASEWPPCSSWDGPSAATVGGATVEWGNAAGFIQESGRNVVEPGQTLTATTYLVVFHSDEPPRFERWSMDYNFAASPPAGDAGSDTARQTAAAPSEPAGTATRFRPDETCAGKAVGSSCWQEIANQPGCYLWNPGLARDSMVTWTGGCSGGWASGSGEIAWEYTSEDGEPGSETGTGELRSGKATGHWTRRASDGSVVEGSYVDGKRDGRWTWRWANGTVEEGHYVNGERHGHWTLRFHGGSVDEGAYVNGKRHGRWTNRDAAGACRWITTYSDGNEVGTDYDC